MRRVLLVGPPGAGKVALARSLARDTVPAPLKGQTLVEAAWIRQGAGLPGSDDAPPFRAPHHTVSAEGLARPTVMSTGRVRPCEVNLAHGGTLLLDELTEFRRDAIAALAGALKAGETEARIGRSESVRIPARPILLVASANLCDCGWAGSGRNACACSARSLASYAARLDDFKRALRLDEVIALGPARFVEGEGFTRQIASYEKA